MSLFLDAILSSRNPCAALSHGELYRMSKARKDRLRLCGLSSAFWGKEGTAAASHAAAVRF